MKAKGEKVVCVTAYDAYFGRLADESGVDVVLVGDSVGNTTLGYDNTIPVTMEDMLHHTRAVSRGVRRALLVADLPFGSYQSSPEVAIRNGIELVKAGARAVKLEGVFHEAIAGLVKAGVPVMGHLGMTPQSVNKFGGFRMQGKGDAAGEIVDQACLLDELGVFAMVLELIPPATAAATTAAVQCPTIGIGAGAHCDGQVQVLHDVCGLTSERYRHSRVYFDGQAAVLKAFSDYASDVRKGAFPPAEPEN